MLLTLSSASTPVPDGAVHFVSCKHAIPHLSCSPSLVTSQNVLLPVHSVH